MKKWILFFLKVLILIISIIVSFSFLTLYERKIIGLSQIRLSPQVNIVLGISQPFVDALKLIKKSFIVNEEKFNLNKFLVFFSFSMMLFYFHFWMIIPLNSGESLSPSSSIMFFLTMLSISLYSLIFICFFSVSKYPFLSMLRSVSQSISYEINFSLVIFSYMILMKVINLSESFFFIYYFYTQLILFFVFIFISIIESFRSPFDFSESESELVSGFSSEVGSLKFIFIFMSEYSIMLFYIILISFIFNFSLLLMLVLTCYLFMFSRSVLPRVRYDYLMNFCWMNLFPFASFLLFIFVLS